MGKLSVFAAFAVSVVVGVIAATAGGAVSPQPLLPAQIAVLDQAPDPSPTVVGSVSISPSELVAPTSDGVVEGVKPAATDGNVCRQVGWGTKDTNGNTDLRSQWSSWPYQRVVIEWRQWCYNPNTRLQTYRYTQVHRDSEICGGHDNYQHKMGGGNGSSYTDVETGAYWDCATAIPFYYTHYDEWQIWRCTTSSNPCVRRVKGPT